MRPEKSPLLSKKPRKLRRAAKLYLAREKFNKRVSFSSQLTVNTVTTKSGLSENFSWLSFMLE